MSEWRSQAACIGAPLDLFFPGPGAPQTGLTICKTCPVKTECLEYAVTTNQQYGLWGGTTKYQRRRLRAEQGLDSRGTGEHYPAYRPRAINRGWEGPKGRIPGRKP